MTYNLELVDERLKGSQYDPVIWEDVKPIEAKLELLEMLVLDLMDIIFVHLPPEAETDIAELVSTYHKSAKP